LWLLLGLMVMSPSLYAASCLTGQAKDEATLVQIEQTWARALDESDVPGLWCILADEFENWDIDGKLVDRSETLANALQHRRYHHKLSELHARVYGDVAYVRGIADAIDAQRQATTRVRFTDVYVYRGGRWQCVAGHESLVIAISE